jgi:hypothetical protein
MRTSFAHLYSPSQQNLEHLLREAGVLKVN